MKKKTLYEDCFDEAMASAMEKGDEVVTFADADKIVVERSKLMVKSVVGAGKKVSYSMENDEPKKGGNKEERKGSEPGRGS